MFCWLGPFLGEIGIRFDQFGDLSVALRTLGRKRTASLWAATIYGTLISKWKMRGEEALEFEKELKNELNYIGGLGQKRKEKEYVVWKWKRN